MRGVGGHLNCVLKDRYAFLGRDNVRGRGRIFQAERMALPRHTGIRKQFHVSGQVPGEATGDEDELRLAPDYKDACT